ncbi:MAG: hypothetical protein ACE5F1_17075 [Planctomycetota bacterium]
MRGRVTLVALLALAEIASAQVSGRGVGGGPGGARGAGHGASGKGSAPRRVPTRVILPVVDDKKPPEPPAPAKKAARKESPEERAAREFRQKQLLGKQVSRAVRKLVRGAKWHRTLRSAAAAAERSGKPILWIQALGTLAGYT